MARTMCNVCLEEFDEAELHYDFDAPVCAECCANLSSENGSNLDAWLTPQS
jgi:hypothetical protein